MIQNDLWAHPTALNKICARAVEGDKNDIEWYHKNYLDHVYAVSDDNGNIDEHYRYSAFGEAEIYSPTGTKLASSAIDNEVLWNSRRFDKDTNLYYYKYRHYKADYGRWLGRDPIEETGGYNLYGFVGNRPLNKWDEFGTAVFIPIVKAAVIAMAKEYVTDKVKRFYAEDFINKVLIVKGTELKMQTKRSATFTLDYETYKEWLNGFEIEDKTFLSFVADSAISHFVGNEGKKTLKAILNSKVVPDWVNPTSSFGKGVRDKLGEELGEKAYENLVGLFKNDIKNGKVSKNFRVDIRKSMVEGKCPRMNVNISIDASIKSHSLKDKIDVNIPFASAWYYGRSQKDQHRPDTYDYYNKRIANVYGLE